MPFTAVFFILLFCGNFVFCLTALFLLALGMLSGVLGVGSLLHIMTVASDLAPLPLCFIGISTICLGILLIILIFDLFPHFIALLNRASCYYLAEAYYPFVYNFKIIRKITGITAIIFVCSAIIGGGLQYIFVHNFGFTSSVCHETVTFQPIRYIDIDATNLDVTVVPYDGKVISVSYSSEDEVYCEQKGSKLFISRQNAFSFSVFAKEQFSYHLTVRLPKYDFLDLYVQTSGGDVYVDGRDFQNISVNTNGGNITILDTAAAVSAKTQGGDVSITLKALTADTKITTTSGDVSFSIPYDEKLRLQFETETGDLTSTFFKEEYSHKKGFTTAQRGNYGHTLTVKTGSGGLRLTAY